MADEITFTPEQQAHLDKLIGEARVKSREKAETEAKQKLQREQDTAHKAALAAEAKWKELAELSAARVAELEPLQAQAEAYGKLIAGTLKDKLKELGEPAKKAVEALPGSLSDAEKLAWLTANAALFQAQGDDVGTPNRPKPKTPKGKPGKLCSQPLRL